MPNLDLSLSLLKAHPIFSEWPHSLLREFAMQMFTTHFAAGEIIVNEGELVDSLYFIVNGVVEVLRQDAYNLQEKMVVATLHKGETIGLSATGLYSTTGKRTATVKAIKSVELVGIKIEILHNFLRAHPSLRPDLNTITTRIWKMQMIKQAAPFAVLSSDQLQWLADRIEEVEVPENTVLFREGEGGDCCYLITHGQVEIIKQNEVIACLDFLALFGETSLIMNVPRGASARANTKCKLLKLIREDLLSIIQQEKITLKLLARMEKERSRPRAKPGIIGKQMVTKSNEFIVTLKNPFTYTYYQLNKEGWFVWQMLDGTHTVKDITLAFEKEFRIFSVSLIASTIVDLTRAGFVDFTELEGYKLVNEVKLPFWMRVIERIRSIMEFEYPFANVDVWITKTFNTFVKVFLTKPAVFIMLLVSIIGMVSFGFFTQHVISLLPHTHNLLWMIILVDIAAIVSIPLHELAHAYTTKYFGHEVHNFGIGWYWVGPMAFTDTSDMWLSTRWRRIAVNVAGMFIDTVVASMVMIVAWLTSINEVSIFCWLFAMFCYLSVFHNLFPLLELDGYYILMDFFERPSLREDAVEWLIEASPKFTQEYKIEIIYWLICLCFIVVTPLIAWFVQETVLNYIFPILGNGYWRFLMPLIAVCLSLLSVYVEIKRHNREAQDE